MVSLRAREALLLLATASALAPLSHARALVRAASAPVTAGAAARADSLKLKLRARDRAGEVGPAAGIQFYDDQWEPDVPDVRLTRSSDGSNGVATFRFDKPSFFNCDREEDVPEGAITAMRLIDEEGEISTPGVNAAFVEGKPVAIIAKYEMRSPAEWDRFMRFMQRYGEANGLGFSKAQCHVPTSSGSTYLAEFNDVLQRPPRAETNESTYGELLGGFLANFPGVYFNFNLP